MIGRKWQWGNWTPGSTPKGKEVLALESAPNFIQQQEELNTIQLIVSSLTTSGKNLLLQRLHVAKTSFRITTERQAQTFITTNTIYQAVMEIETRGESSTEYLDHGRWRWKRPPYQGVHPCDRDYTIPLKAETVTFSKPCFAIRLDEEQTP